MPEQPPKTDEKGNLPPEVVKVLEDIKSKMDDLSSKETVPPAPATPTPADRRAAIQKSLGFNDEQMAAHEESIMRAQAPVVERTAWQALEKKPDLDRYRSDIEKELEFYPQEKRTPEMMEKIYFYVRGKHADSKPPSKAPDPSDRVRGSRVVTGPGYSGSDPGLSGGGEGGGSGDDAEQLNDTEKFVANKLGVSEKDYAKSRNVGKSIRELRIPDPRQATSLADIELRKLTGNR